MVGFVAYICLVITLFQEVAKYRIILYSLNLICDDVLYILLYLRVVSLYFRSHLGLIFGLILEVRNQRDWLICLFFLGNLVGINDNLGMKNLLLDALPEVVGYGSNKHSLRKCRDFTCRNKGIELSVEGAIGVLMCESYRPAFL